MNRINSTPVRHAPALVGSQENMFPGTFVHGQQQLNKKSLASSSSGLQVKSLKLSELKGGSSSLKGGSNKLAERLVFNTPSALARRKLGNVSNQTPISGTGSQKSGPQVGSFKKPLSLSARKEDSFVKPLHFAAAPEQQQLLHQMSASPTKAVPSLPTVYEDIENMHPLGWKALREEADPMLIGPYGLEDLSEMPCESEEDEGDESQNKENLVLNYNMMEDAQAKLPLFKAAPTTYRRRKLHNNNNFSRLMTLDEICDLV